MGTELQRMLLDGEEAKCKLQSRGKEEASWEVWNEAGVQPAAESC